MKLSGRVAVVTGAGRGIGRTISLTFAKEGADLALVSRSLNEIEATRDQITSLGGRALAIEADVTDRAAVQRMVEMTIDKFGTIDVLVNNAGILGPVGVFYENSPDLWARTISVNLIGTYQCCVAVLRPMMKQRQGKIINLSGGGAANPRPRFSAYAASKAAVVRFTETIAEELKEFNIQVNAIAPGAVNTRMLDEILIAGEKAGDSNLAEALKQKRTGGTKPDFAAELAVFLASDESDGLTGRLLSAIWDDWKEIPKNIQQVLSSDRYTLRRIT